MVKRISKAPVIYREEIYPPRTEWMLSFAFIFAMVMLIVFPNLLTVFHDLFIRKRLDQIPLSLAIVYLVLPFAIIVLFFCFKNWKMAIEVYNDQITVRQSIFFERRIRYENLKKVSSFPKIELFFRNTEMKKGGPIVVFEFATDQILIIQSANPEKLIAAIKQVHYIDG